MAQKPLWSASQASDSFYRLNDSSYLYGIRPTFWWDLLIYRHLQRTCPDIGLNPASASLPDAVRRCSCCPCP
jgi:hypothetical protein